MEPTNGMRVAVIAKDFPAPGQPEGGIVVMRQIEALAQLGHKLLVVRVVPYAPALTEKWRRYCEIPERYTINNVEVRTLRAVFAPRLIGLEFLPLQVGGALRRVIRDFDPHVVHAHCVIPSGQLAAYQPVPAILTAHGSDAYDWAWRRPGLRRAAAEGIGQASVVVAVSDFIRERVQALFERDVNVIFNAADERVFADTNRTEARLALGVDEKRFVVSFTGRPPKNKGAFDLIEALARIPDARPLAFICGPDSGDVELRSSLAKHRVEGRLFGMLEHRDLARVLSASDAFALPSYREGLPLAICEAMLSALPIVATRVGGIPEIVRDGVEGYLVEPGDVASLAMRLSELANNRCLARELGQRAGQFARSHLTWRANALAYDALYRRIGNAAA